MTHLRPQIVAAAFIVGLFVATGPHAASVAQNSEFGFAAGGDLQNFGEYRTEALSRWRGGRRMQAGSGSTSTGT
jgi:hypothetical protein